MKKLVIAFALILSACDEPSKPANYQVHDQCLRAQIFKECLERLPKGPESIAVTGNSWHKVVSECEDAASYQSLRMKSTVKPECSSY